MGRKLWVTVTVAEEIRGNLVLSERQAWVCCTTLPSFCVGLCRNEWSCVLVFL